MGLAPIYKECFLIGKRETEKCALCQDLKDMVRIFHLTPLAQSSRNLWCLELSSTNFCWSQAFTSFTNSVRESLKKNRAPIFALNVEGHDLFWWVLFYTPKVQWVPSLPLRSDFRSEDLQLKNPGGVAYSNSGSATWVFDVDHFTHWDASWCHWSPCITMRSLLAVSTDNDIVESSADCLQNLFEYPSKSTTSIKWVGISWTLDF